jgi:hypothetical protein
MTAAVGGCAGNGGEAGEQATVTVTQTVDSNVGTSANYPTAATVRMWKKKWCSTQLGMTGDQLKGIMGPPTSELPDNLQWQGFEWTFNAKIKTDGSAYNLQWGDATRPPKRDIERGELPCNWLRVSR